MRTVRLPASRLYFYITLFRVCTSAHLDGGSPFRRLSIFNFTVSREIRYSLYFLTISFIPRISRSFNQRPYFDSPWIVFEEGTQRSSRYSTPVSFFGSRRSNTGEISGEAEGGKSACPQVVISMDKSLCSLLSGSKKKRKGRSRLPPHLLRGRSMRRHCVHPRPTSSAKRDERTGKEKKNSRFLSRL